MRYYDLDIKGGLMKRLLLIPLILVFMFSCGEDVDNQSVDPPPVIPPPQTALWRPPQTPGLHLILERADKKLYFSALRTADGLLLGNYGLYHGGPDIQFFDGTLTTEQNFPDRESIFDLFMPDDGLPLATTEHYGGIYKRTAPGQWERKYSRPRQQDVMLYLRRAGNALYGNWDSFDSSHGGLVKSTDQGNTWHDVAPYTQKSLYGMASDGNNIYLAGLAGGYRSGHEYPILMDIAGNVLASRPTLKGYSWWGVVKSGNLFNMGTWHDYARPDGHGYIDAFDGVTLSTVYTTDRPHIHAMQIGPDGKRYAVATWDWDASDSHTSLFLSSVDGYHWSVTGEIPCPHINGMHFADGGVYLLGGKKDGYGGVYFWKF